MSARPPLKVTSLPLSRLITPRGEARRVGGVGVEAIGAMLRAGPIRFVIADVGCELQWISEASAFTEWKREIRPHLAEPDQKVFLKDFPGEYAYFASQWQDGSTPIIVLSKAH